jgi:hypothetical protein
VVVQKETDEALLLVVLEALGRVGDGRAVLPVERLEKKGRTAQIRRAAAAILPILRDRQDKENAHATLLRASTTPNDAPNVLLRPAHFVQDGSPLELLRPVDNSPPLDLTSYAASTEAAQTLTAGTSDTPSAFDAGSALSGGFTSAAEAGSVGDGGGGGGE